LEPEVYLVKSFNNIQLMSPALPTIQNPYLDNNSNIRK